LNRNETAAFSYSGCAALSHAAWTEQWICVESLCRIVAAPRAMRLIKEMALALGIAIGAEGIAKITEWLTPLGRSWPVH